MSFTLRKLRRSRSSFRSYKKISKKRIRSENQKKTNNPPPWKKP